MTIADLIAGQRARVAHVRGLPELETKLREIGFCEGDFVELMAVGPVGGEPLAVRLNRRLIAMRRVEAAAITVERIRD